MPEPIDVFDNIELSQLHQILNDVCCELDIGADKARRDEVAATIMELARNGERDIGAIRQRAVIKLTNGQN